MEGWMEWNEIDYLEWNRIDARNESGNGWMDGWTNKNEYKLRAYQLSPPQRYISCCGPILSPSHLLNSQSTAQGGLNTKCYNICPDAFFNGNNDFKKTYIYAI